MTEEAFVALAGRIGASIFAGVFDAVFTGLAALGLCILLRTLRTDPRPRIIPVVAVVSAATAIGSGVYQFSRGSEAASVGWWTVVLDTLALFVFLASLVGALVLAGVRRFTHRRFGARSRAPGTLRSAGRSR